MATHDLDQKLLGRLAKNLELRNPNISSALFKILGISVQLTSRLVRARKIRKLDSPRDAKTLALYHHIIFLAREGLYLLEQHVLEYAETGRSGAELRIFALKLRASFYHIFCLFHNNPSVNQLQSASTQRQAASPLSPRQGNGQRRRTPPGNTSPRQPAGKENPPQSPQTGRNRKATLREQIPSMASETSYVTNPYAMVSPPPGLNPLTAISNPSNFLLPALNYLPITQAIFENAAKLAVELLPGSSPLRLSVALEYCAFLWDCLHDHDNSRRLARRTIRDVYRAQEGMNDEEFEDAAVLVGTLGRMMRRKSQDGTPRFGDMTPPSRGPSAARSSTSSPQQSRRSPLQTGAIGSRAR